jgi:hypothetical protein
MIRLPLDGAVEDPGVPPSGLKIPRSAKRPRSEAEWDSGDLRVPGWNIPRSALRPRSATEWDCGALC